MLKLNNSEMAYTNSTNTCRLYLGKGEAYSYKAIVAIRKDDVWYMTRRKYSVTTSKHCTLLLRELLGLGCKVEHVDNIDSLL